MDTTPYLPDTNTSVTLRLRLENTPGTLARATSAIGEEGGNIGAIDLVQAHRDYLVRDVTVNTEGSRHARRIADRLNTLQGIQLVNVSDRTFLLHLGGKLEIQSKIPIQTRAQLSMAYTPGVARVCRAIYDDPESAHALTIKRNTVAVVTDGSAVLGLGDIGPAAALPVMEGKAQLLKEFAGVDAFPLCLDTQDVDEIVRTVIQVAPVFGGINLEDIAAPRCFAVERRLRDALDIPVFHDDQHGTAVVATAALINALKLVGKAPADLKVVLVGVGAAGTAVTRMLQRLGVENVIGADREGALCEGRENLPPDKRRYVETTNPDGEEGSVHEVIAGADVFIGLSGPDVIGVPDLKKMARDPIVFALANPVPEIMPEAAYPHVAVMATGRSDYPNQINNVLCFPGLFKGVLACRATAINEPMKIAAARAIAGSIEEENLTVDYIVPSVFDRRVVERVATAIERAAMETGIARKGVAREP